MHDSIFSTFEGLTGGRTSFLFSQYLHTSWHSIDKTLHCLTSLTDIFLQDLI
jgi:hypothetical protein